MEIRNSRFEHLFDGISGFGSALIARNNTFKYVVYPIASSLLSKGASDRYIDIEYNYIYIEGSGDYRTRGFIRIVRKLDSYYSYIPLGRNVTVKIMYNTIEGANPLFGLSIYILLT